MRATRRLISIAHSYGVALNRRLADEMGRQSDGRWEVTAVAPSFFHGDLRPVPLETQPGEQCRLEAVPAHWTERIHLMHYGRRLRQLLSESWDLVHCWEEPFIVAGGQVGWWTPKRTPLVYATFQNLPKRYPPPLAWIERYAMNRAAAWIAFGHTIDDTLSKRKLYTDRPRRIIPLGVDTERFQPCPQARARIHRQLDWADPGPPVVGVLGRFVREKGLELLMRVLDRTPSPWRALFVGVGPLEDALRNWGNRHGDRVRVVTGVRHDDVPAYLNAMDVLCAPSQTTSTWREQLGRMLIEAFACGVPVIGSDSGEIPHVVDGAGVVVGEKDEPAWLDAISEVLESPARRAELGRRGLDRAGTVYAWPVVARQHLDFFSDLV
ncbi:MAG: glycosyltransferase family 4 protein [Planctomycetes bacterium]|nr:glycosyltransferase family 4 protein [Planctomycetota bacterium]